MGPLHKLYSFRKTLWAWAPPWAAVRIPAPLWLPPHKWHGDNLHHQGLRLLVNHPHTKTQPWGPDGSTTGYSGGGKETLCPVVQTTLVLPQCTEGSLALRLCISIHFYQKAKQFMLSQTTHDVNQSTVHKNNQETASSVGSGVKLKSWPKSKICHFNSTPLQKEGCLGKLEKHKCYKVYIRKECVH